METIQEASKILPSEPIRKTPRETPTLRESVAGAADMVDGGWKDIALFLLGKLAEIGRGRDERTGAILSARNAARHARAAIQEAREAVALYGPEE